MATAAHLERYQPVTFAAFRIGENGRTAGLPFAEPPADLKAALAAALPGCLFKEKLAIREKDEESGTVLVHLFVVRRKAPKWVHPTGEIMPRRVIDHYADPICTIDGRTIAGLAGHDEPTRACEFCGAL